MSRSGLLGLLVLSLTGCASTLSGLGGTPTYACQAPVGALCTSVSGVYANALHGMAEIPRPPARDPLPVARSDAYGKTKATTPSPDTTPALAIDSTIEPGAWPRREANAAPSATPSPFNPAPSDASPRRSAPRLLRLWIAPWEDSDGDLYDASFVHVVVDHGRWLLPHVSAAARGRLDQVMPPEPLPTPTPPSPEPSRAPIVPEISGSDVLPISGASSTAP